MNLIKEISNEIKKVINCNIDLDKYIEISSNFNRGEFVFKAFKVSQLLNISPNVLALKIKKGVRLSFINNIEAINGYVNFYVDKNTYIEKSLTDIVNNTFGFKLQISNNKYMHPYKNIESHKYIRQLSKFAVYNFTSNIFTIKGYDYSNLCYECSNDILDNNMQTYIANIMGILLKMKIIYTENSCLCINLKEYNEAPFIIINNNIFTKESILLFNILYYLQNSKKVICIYEECNKNLYNKIYNIIKIISEEFACNYFFIPNYSIKVLNNNIFSDINSIIFYILSHNKNEKVIFHNNNYLNKYCEIQNCIINAHNFLSINEKCVFNQNINTIDIYNVTRFLYNCTNVLKQAVEDIDSSILCAYIIKVSDNLNKIIKTKKVDNNIILLVKASLIVIEKGLLILGIDVS